MVAANRRDGPQMGDGRPADPAGRPHLRPRRVARQGGGVRRGQVVLFRLVLAPKQPIHYGGLYPEESRDIFVRDGLVTGEINTRSAFVARNRKTLAQAEAEEAKQRRAGLVVDEEWMARWYRDRIPAEGTSAQAPAAWYARSEESPAGKECVST